MIIDQSTLAGKKAYLRNTEGKINIIDIADSGDICQAHSDPIGEGMVIEVDGLSLQIIREDILELYQRMEHGDELISIKIIKEIFPGLFKDPFENRVHNISGFEDFTRGHNFGFRLMEVDGIPTLVSTIENPKWTSEIYKMSHPVMLNSMAWILHDSKLTYENAFTYDIILYIWEEGQALETQPVELVVATGAKPDSQRSKDNLNRDLAVIAYKVKFEAKVRHDAFLKERHVGELSDISLGRPLLKAVNLLETVPSSHVYHSIQEIIQDSYEYKLFDSNDSTAPERFTAMLNIRATLTKGESINLTARRDDKLKHLEARLNAQILQRPPRIDKEVR